MIPASPLSRLVRRVLRRPIAEAATVPGADAYRKHFTAEAHLWLLLWHGLAASPSLRQTHAAAAVDGGDPVGPPRQRHQSQSVHPLLA